MKSFAQALKGKPTAYMNNGTRRMPYEDKIYALIFSIATSAIVGCFVFLWNAKGELVKLQQQQFETNKTLDEINIKINNIQLDIRDVRERAIKLESKK